jgi:hypothetical protein
MVVLVLAKVVVLALVLVVAAVLDGAAVVGVAPESSLQPTRPAANRPAVPPRNCRRDHWTIGPSLQQMHRLRCHHT